MNFSKNSLFAIRGFKDCCSLSLKRRLCDLGLFEGQKFRILSTSILKKVVLIEVGGFSLSLQKKLLDNLLLEQAK